MNERWEKIKEIFVDQFGEERVEFDGSGGYATLTIWFPEVTVVRNEDENIRTKIWDCFVRYEITENGRLMNDKPTLAVTKVTEAQYISNYKHSHVPAASNWGNYVNFTNVCTGHSPMASTCLSLWRDYNEVSWDILATETSVFLNIESGAGIPYKCISSISSEQTEEFPIELYNDIYVGKIEDDIRLMFIGIRDFQIFTPNGMTLGLTHSDLYWLIKMSKVLYKPEYERFFVNAVYKDSDIYTITNASIESIPNNSGVMFKGRLYPLRIVEQSEVVGANVKVLKPSVYRQLMVMKRFYDTTRKLPNFTEII